MRLRPYKKCDEKYLMKWFDDERKFQMWSAGNFKYPLDEAQLSEYKQKYENDENGCLFTMLDDEGIPVGHIMMRSIDYKNSSAHVGFIVVDSNQRGKGYGKELVNLITKYAFDILKVERVTLYVYDVNPGAKKCYESVGFKVERVEKNLFEYKEERWQYYLMAKNK